MHNILIIGAGRSATALIKYVLEKAAQSGWIVTVADADPELARQKIGEHPNGRATWLDVTKTNDRRDLIERSDLVVSLLPAHLHLEVAHDCIRLRKHLITASYVSKEMYLLGDEARDRELIFMGEMGLDPGIDHMSARKKIDEIKAKGGKITAFRSYAGGLISPESNDNPWHYKFTWNPRNVVLAGQGTAQFMEGGRYKYIPYNRLFSEYKVVDILGFGKMEMYANRDSLLYRDVYGLSGIPDLIRGTLRYTGFCDVWAALVKIGLTDASFPIVESAKLTYQQLIEAYLPPARTNDTIKERLAGFLQVPLEGTIMQQLDWIGLFSKKRIELEQATPALILEDLLLKKWQLRADDKDMVVMQHEFEYELDGVQFLLRSAMILKGDNSTDTAMAKLVGLPMGIFANMVMNRKIATSGVHIPVMQQVYEPVLKELEEYGVQFIEKEEIISPSSNR